MITQKILKKIVMEEVKFVEERFMSSKFRKAIENYQDLQLKQQQLQKKFVSTKDTKQREKLKKALIKLHYIVKKAEVEFNSALQIEPVDYQEESVKTEVNESTGIVEAKYESITEDYSQRARNFRVNLRTRLETMKKGQKISYGKLYFIKDGKNFEANNGRKFSVEGVVQAFKHAVKPDIKTHRGAAGADMVNAYLKFEDKSANESTKAYGDSLKKIARDKQMKMLSKKDKETLLKIADLMKRANEGTIQATDEQMNQLKERFNQITNENWFSDLGAKAKQAYIKVNPNSKYAKGVASGEKEAPMTGKQKDAAQQDAKDQAYKDREQERIQRKKTARLANNIANIKARDQFQHIGDQAMAFIDPDIDKQKQAMADVTNQLEKETGFKLDAQALGKMINGDKFDDDETREALGNMLENPNKENLRDFLASAVMGDSAYGVDFDKLSPTQPGAVEKAIEEDLQVGKSKLTERFDYDRARDVIESAFNWNNVESEGRDETRFDFKGGGDSMWISSKGKVRGNIPRNPGLRRAIKDLGIKEGIIREGILTEAKDRVLNKLFQRSRAVTSKSGEDKLYKLSQDWEDWNVDNDDKYDDLVDHLFAAVELVQDAGTPGTNNVTADKEYYSYMKSADKHLKTFTKDVAKAMKLHKESVVTEADDDREYDKYSYHGDTLVAGITPAHNIDPDYGYGNDFFALVMVDMSNSVDKVLYVGNDSAFKKIIGKFALDGTKKANMSSLLKTAAKSGYANVSIPKAVYQKLKKNSGKLLKTSVQVNGLKGMSEDKLFPRKPSERKVNKEG